MSSEDLKARVLAARLPKGKVSIEGVGDVTVRGMTRDEIFDSPRDDPRAAERWVLSRCIIDPVLTEDDIAEWQKSAPAGELNDVSNEVNRLSGIQQAKERFPKV
jgi:hypothetical protein